MSAVIKTITSGSPVSGTIIKPNDILNRINGNEINDILDYMFYSYDSLLMLELTGENSILKYVTIKKDEGSELGLKFVEPLLTKEQACVNNCIFCFIDQLPKDMRKSLYYKDDDLRLSFLQGNYITLTNLSRTDIRRIIKLHISPINVSIHTMDSKLHNKMTRNKKSAKAIKMLYRLAKSGIVLNCQIVCCPGINDGVRLNRTLKKLKALSPSVNSVSVVPVGLTKFRDNLVPLTAFERDDAIKVIRQVDHIAKICKSKYKKRVFYCSDELYIKAGKQLPQYDYYDDFPQLENGVGKMRLFITEFMEALKKDVGKSLNNRALPHDAIRSARGTPRKDGEKDISIKPFSIATGFLAAGYIKQLLKKAEKWYDHLHVTVYAIKNEFFGESITVSGLITGIDIYNELKAKDLGSRLLIPKNMLRNNDDVFLDNMTTRELSDILRIPIQVVNTNGYDFFDAILSESI